MGAHHEDGHAGQLPQGKGQMGTERCCYVLYSIQSREQTWNQKYSTQWHSANNISIESRARSKGDATSPATSTSVAGIINLFVGDFFGTGGTEMEQRVSYPDLCVKRLEGCALHRTKNSLDEGSSIRTKH